MSFVGSEPDISGEVMQHQKTEDLHVRNGNRANQILNMACFITGILSGHTLKVSNHAHMYAVAVKQGNIVVLTCTIN